MATPARRASCGPRGAKRCAGQLDASGVGRMRTAEDLHQRALARAVLADQGQHLARAHIQVHAAQRLRRARSAC